MEKAKVIDAWIQSGNYLRRSIHEIRQFSRVMGYSESYVAFRVQKNCYEHDVLNGISKSLTRDTFEDSIRKFKHDIEADIKHVDVDQLYENFKRFHG
jgi:hypothetical protein